MTGEILLSASLQGGFLVGLVLLVFRLVPSFSPNFRVWVWRLVYLKLALLLLPIPPIGVPVLPSNTASVVRTSAQETQRTAQELPQARQQKSEALKIPTDIWVLLWMGGVMLAASRDIKGCLNCRRAVLKGDPPKGRALTSTLQQLTYNAGLVRRPILLQSKDIETPFVSAGKTPVIVVPLAVEDSADMRLMLAHEVAHISRKDLVWNALHSVVHALFFFHPLVWLAARSAHQAQESAADLAAVRIANSSPRRYAEMLVRATVIPSNPGMAMSGSLAMNSSYQDIHQRLTDMRNSTTKPTLAKLAFAAVLAATTIAATPAYRLEAASEYPSMPNHEADGLRPTIRLSTGTLDSKAQAKEPALGLPKVQDTAKLKESAIRGDSEVLGRGDEDSAIDISQPDNSTPTADSDPSELAGLTQGGAGGSGGGAGGQGGSGGSGGGTGGQGGSGGSSGGQGGTGGSGGGAGGQGGAGGGAGGQPGQGRSGGQGGTGGAPGQPGQPGGGGYGGAGGGAGGTGGAPGQPGQPGGGGYGGGAGGSGGAGGAPGQPGQPGGGGYGGGAGGSGGVGGAPGQPGSGGYGGASGGAGGAGGSGGSSGRPGRPGRGGRGGAGGSGGRGGASGQPGQAGSGGQGGAGGSAGQGGGGAQSMQLDYGRGASQVGFGGVRDEFASGRTISTLDGEEALSAGQGNHVTIVRGTGAARIGVVSKPGATAVGRTGVTQIRSANRSRVNSSRKGRLLNRKHRS